MGEAQRSCIVTGETLPQAELLRFAISPDGLVVPDVAGKIPGRGVWISPKADLLQKAIDTKAFARSAKAPVTLPADLLEKTREGLRKKLIETLHLCRKSGVLLHGFEKVKAELQKEKVAILIHAEDAAHDGRAKLNKLIFDDVKVVEFLPRTLLAEAIGRENAVHIALTHSKMSEFFWHNAQRFAGFIES